jgi:hypothetical protein
MAGVSATQAPTLTGGRYTLDDDADTMVMVDDGPTDLTAILIDNSAYATAISVHLWDSNTAIKGTTDPHALIPVPASTQQMVSFPNGLTFLTGLQYDCSKDGMTDADSPATPPNIHIVTNGGN